LSCHNVSGVVFTGGHHLAVDASKYSVFNRSPRERCSQP
jgi:hypothetical protein